MDATCKIQDNIHVFSLAHKYVSKILGTYQNRVTVFYCSKLRRKDNRDEKRRRKNYQRRKRGQKARI